MSAHAHVRCWSHLTIGCVGVPHGLKLLSQAPISWRQSRSIEGPVHVQLKPLSVVGAVQHLATCMLLTSTPAVQQVALPMYRSRSNQLNMPVNKGLHANACQAPISYMCHSSSIQYHTPVNRGLHEKSAQVSHQLHVPFNRRVACKFRSSSYEPHTPFNIWHSANSGQAPISYTHRSTDGTMQTPVKLLSATLTVIFPLL